MISYTFGWLFIALSLYLAYRVLAAFNPIDKQRSRRIIKSILKQEKSLSDVYRIVLMKRRLDLLNEEEIPEWLKKSFLKAVKKKLNVKS